MEGNSSSGLIRRGLTYGLRVALGLSILVAVALVFTVMGWCFDGFRQDMAPKYWPHEPSMVFFLAYRGGLVSLFGLTILWVLGQVAIGIGDLVIKKWRRLGIR